MLKTIVKTESGTTLIIDHEQNTLTRKSDVPLLNWNLVDTEVDPNAVGIVHIPELEIGKKVSAILTGPPYQYLSTEVVEIIHPAWEEHKQKEVSDMGKVNEEAVPEQTEEEDE